MKLRIKESGLIYLVAFLLSSCTAKNKASASSVHFDLQDCMKKEGSEVCSTVDESLNELSGITAHSVAEDVFWVVNDQGAPKVYAINRRGEILSTILLDTMDFDDAEDISIGKGPDPSKKYIYVGDIGKARKKAGTVKLFRFPEPTAEEIKNPSLSIQGAQLIRLRYSESKERDFETQLVDPITGDLFLMEKDGFKVYRAKYTDLVALPEVLESGSLSLEEVRDKGDWEQNLSGGAVSPDGYEILIRNNEKAWYFTRRPGESIDAALKKPDMVINLRPEFNGEAIAFDKDGRGFYTVSENVKNDRTVKTGPQPVSFYKRSN